MIASCGTAPGPASPPPASGRRATWAPPRHPRTPRGSCWWRRWARLGREGRQGGILGERCRAALQGTHNRATSAPRLGPSLQPPHPHPAPWLAPQRTTTSSATCLLPAVYGANLWFDCVKYTDSSGSADICPTPVREGGAAGREDARVACGEVEGCLGKGLGSSLVSFALLASLQGPELGSGCSSPSPAFAPAPGPHPHRRGTGTCAPPLARWAWPCPTPSRSGRRAAGAAACSKPLCGRHSGCACNRGAGCARKWHATPACLSVLPARPAAAWRRR